ncbi:hypothetical protein [Jiulongibacter sp. NS-SX5]|uniref:hypothetical protein n=1 Tax=Jiulongibacter sp. NS-SX5 TaxID=3463854 RepID=UPI004058273F
MVLFRNTVILVFGLIGLFACKKVHDLGIRPLGTSQAVGEQIRNCDIRDIEHSQGLKMTVQYDDGNPYQLLGFFDFDQLIYEGGNIVEARNSTLNNGAYYFEYNGNNDLQSMTFSGRDGVGRPIENKSIMSYNGTRQLVSLELDLVIFEDIVKFAFDYNDDGNITKISVEDDGNWQTILENKEFDDKKSPFAEQRQLGQILSYFMAYTALNGDVNYTYFLNQNNATKWVITNNGGTSEFSTAYDYDGDYPIKSNMSKTQNGRLSSVTESYAYNCQ